MALWSWKSTPATMSTKTSTTSRKITKVQRLRVFATATLEVLGQLRRLLSLREDIQFKMNVERDIINHI